MSTEDRLAEQSWTHDRTGWDSMDHGQPTKTLWASPGAWHAEPDKVQWVDSATGYACLAKRNNLGVWCGYVGVPTGHRYHGVSYTYVEVTVHGGLTYADFCTGEADPATGICHIPAPGSDPHVWWLGFDCGHYMDLWPRYPDYLPTGIGGYPSIYRTLSYVQDQCRQLARQLMIVASPEGGP